MGSAVQRVTPRRERARAATIEEIKTTARALMREHGSTEVRFTDIARAMDMTPPALYRYFTDRDELLSALITDGYDDLGRCVADARDAAPEDLASRWMAISRAYRDWALREPQQFALILGLPIPGYVAPPDGPTTEAAQRALSQLTAIFTEALRLGQLRPPLIRTVDPALEACIVAKNGDMATTIPPETFQAMLHAWAALHGFTSLEANGHLHWLDADGRDALFTAQMRLAALASGMPTAPADPET